VVRKEVNQEKDVAQKIQKDVNLLRNVIQNAITLENQEEYLITEEYVTTIVDQV